MLFDGEVTMLRIISVLELEWKEARKSALPRDFHALSFRIKGDAAFGLEGNEYHVKSGDICYMPKGVGYDLRQGDEHIIVIHFETDCDEKIRRFFSFSPQNPEIYRSLFEEIRREWYRQKDGLNYAATAIFHNILGRIHLEAFNGYARMPSGALGEVVEYIHANFTDPDISIAALSDIYGTSESYFRRAFKDTLGTTPLKYIGDLRQKYAEELLRLGYYSITEVAEKVGFTDPKYFSRFFGKRTGMPPSVIK